MVRPGACIDGQGGWVLPATMILAAVMMISVLTVLELGATDGTLAKRDVDATRSLFLAESGVQKGQAWLRAQSSLPTTPTCPFGGGVDTLGAGTYSVAITPDTVGGRVIYTVASTGIAGTRSRSLEADVSPQSFTDYLYYVNRNVGGGWPHWFYTGEVIDGPLHCNDEFGIMGDPVFTDHVSSGANTFFYYNNGSPVSLPAANNPPYDHPDFQDGYTLGGATMGWLDQSDLHIVKDMADLTLNGNYEIVFGRDGGDGHMIGTVSYRKNKNWTDVSISSLSNGIVYVNGNCEVSGIVDGQVTVCTNGNLDIVDDLTVFDSDSNGPREGCDDIVGLMAGSKVNVAENDANNDDCVLHAYLIAVNNQGCLVENYGQGSPRGTLTLYGGIGQDKWGPVGTGYWDGDEIVVLTGYERDFHYDWRLRSLLPPGFDAIAFTGGALVRVAWRDVTP